MIFVSLGTHEQPFERLLDLVEPLAREGRPLLVQHGSTPARPGLPNTSWQQFMAFEEVRAHMLSAELIVCHAGVGTIITALQSGKRPVVIPRRRVGGEHVDDHQTDIATRLGEQGLIVLVEGPEDLQALDSAADGAGTPVPRSNPRLGEAVREATDT